MTSRMGFVYILAVAPLMAYAQGTSDPWKARVEAINNQDRKGWDIDRWLDSDSGAFLSGTIASPQIKGMKPTYKGIAVRLGRNGEAAMVFDTELIRTSVVWTGGFLQVDPFKMALLRHPETVGDIQMYTQPGPGWAKRGDFKDPRPSPYGPLPSDWAKYRGLYEFGDRVVFSYAVGGTKVLESPWVESRQGVRAFTRSFEIEPSDRSMTVLLHEESHSQDRLDVVDGVGVKGLGYGEHQTLVAVVQESAVAIALVVEGAQILLTVPPHEKTLRFKVLASRLSTAKGSNAFTALIEASEAPEDLQAMTHGGPRLWPNPIEAEGIVNEDTGPFVIDTIPVPYDNPYDALMLTSGLDFLAPGRLAVSTIHGDVWVVSGVDATLKGIRWQRFATGLFQPLGLRVVAGVIHVLGRDQITRLHDLNGDGEADFYENFNNDCEVAGGGHAFATCLETDAQGNFYYLKGHEGSKTQHDGCVLKVSADGEQLSVFATGYRYPNGMSIGPDDRVTVADQEGSWVPATRIDFVSPGMFSGFMNAHHRDTPPHRYADPLCWLPQEMDNSSGNQVWISNDTWGPLSGQMLSLAYGHCTLLLVLRDQVAGVWQGGALRLPLQFLSGIMRGRFSPHDGHLYVCGLRGWQTSAVREGCLQRVRFTGVKVYQPHGLKVYADGIGISFSEPLDRELAEDPDSYAIHQWNYRWAKEYGSKNWSVKNPDQEGEDPVEIASIHLSRDRRSVFLEILDLRPVMQMRIRYNLDAADGELVKGEICNTINRVGLQPMPKRGAGL